ncbi:hypothetical protein [Stieleria mannarensis]|uniref:hypothetical protein n=1 Tax=Stieleria mannarensis TaxID=2755585 RepID=UPI001C7278B4|nr:hypothetical protein [Rhodopirellula sp. JC639]
MESTGFAMQSIRCFTPRQLFLGTGKQQVILESSIVEKYLADLARRDVISHHEAVAHAANHDTFDKTSGPGI